MLPNKQVYYDARSMNPAVGDTCQVLIHHDGQEPETLTAVYLGSVQLDAYTNPYYKFLINRQVRLISSNAVREWRYMLAAPAIAPQLPGLDDEA